jgi:hypothetical protein
MLKGIFALVLILAAIPCISAKRKAPEKHYQAAILRHFGGESEKTMGDNTRCDILTDTHAIEVDFADKWSEAIGQSLNYGFQANRRSGIVLILEEEDDYRHALRVSSIVSFYALPVDLWVIDPDLKVQLFSDTPKAAEKTRGSIPAWSSQTPLKRPIEI